MATVMNSEQLVQALKNIVKYNKTLYVRGCIGSPLTPANKARYLLNPYNAQPSRAAKIAAASSDTFGFDCSCLIKSILWGWVGDKNATYGGAKYASNGVPDLSANTIITLCSNVRKVRGNESTMLPGEAVWIEGHIGVYIGDGQVIECTPRWKDGVQVTALNARNWAKCGKLPWVLYKRYLKPGDIVRITGDTYYNGKKVPAWVKSDLWEVHSVNGNRIVVNYNSKRTVQIMSAFHADSLQSILS